MTLQDIKETKRYGRTDGRTDRRMDNVKTVYPSQTKFARGIINPTGKPWWAWQQPKHQAPTISSIDKSLNLNHQRGWSRTNRRAIKEESKNTNRDWVDHQACSLLQYITVIAKIFIMGNYFNEQSSSIYAPSHHRIQVPNVLCTREIKVQHGI